MIEFNDQETSLFDEVIAVLERHPSVESLQLKDETAVSLPGFEVYPDSRKVYRDRREINLTTKEYELLYLLVVNKGRVLTYEQIYQSVWGEEALGNENNAVKCHIRNLRKKLYKAVPEALFTIRCVREVGYCLEVKPK